MVGGGDRGQTSTETWGEGHSGWGKGRGEIAGNAFVQKSRQFKEEIWFSGVWGFACLSLPTGLWQKRTLVQTVTGPALPSVKIEGEKGLLAFPFRGQPSPARPRTALNTDGPPSHHSLLGPFRAPGRLQVPRSSQERTTGPHSPGVLAGAARHKHSVTAPSKLQTKS